MPKVQKERSKGPILFAIILALFLAALDQTVVGTALTRIVTDLGGTSLYTWVVTSYLLALTITVLIYGKFSDVFGRKSLLIIGISLGRSTSISIFLNFSILPIPT